MNRFVWIAWRGALTLLLGAVSALLLQMAMWINDGTERIAKDRAYLAQFQQITAQVKQYRARFHHFPNDAELASFGPTAGFPQFQINASTPTAEALAASEDDAPPDFSKALPAGGFVLRFWRGEWYEYYASWSGETTLVPTATRYQAAFRTQALGDIMLALAVLLLAWWASPHRMLRNGGLSKPRDSR